MKGILGRKIGMTQVFAKNGKLIPVTVVEVAPNIVTQIKTKETDGYEAIQLGVFDRKENRATKAAAGHAKKANTTPKRFLKEIRNVNITDYTLGSVLSASIFEVGESVDVTGTSKGKGFQGVIKRHNQSRGPMTHGSRFHRRPGSMGTMRPMRVMPGKKLPGHMGNETITIQNLMIVDVNEKENYILVSGNIPGPKNSLVLIKSAVKTNKKHDIELLTYEDEAIIDEVVETTESETTEITDVVEEVLEEAVTSEEANQPEEITDEAAETPESETEGGNE